MTQTEAIEELKKGKKVTHPFFSSGWIKKHRKSTTMYIDDIGQIYNIDTFWRFRNNKKWQSGWSVFIKQ